MTRGAVDLLAELAECLRAAYGDGYADPPEEVQLRGMLAITWTRRLSGDRDYTLHRVVLSPEDVDADDHMQEDQLISAFCKEMRDLVSDDVPGVCHVVRFYNVVQHRHHEELYCELYEIEMRLREVLTYIFLDQAPSRPYSFLDGTATRLQGDKGMHTSEYLRAHDENELFHVLFDDYDDLNQKAVARPNDLIPLIRESQSYEKLRDAISDAPIKTERHVIFLAALKELVPAIEAVRNAIAHNRDLSDSTRENYDIVKPRLFKVIEDFWTSEVGEGAILTATTSLSAAAVVVPPVQDSSDAGGTSASVPEQEPPNGGGSGRT